MCRLNVFVSSFTLQWLDPHASSPGTLSILFSEQRAYTMIRYSPGVCICSANLVAFLFGFSHSGKWCSGL